MPFLVKLLPLLLLPVGPVVAQDTTKSKAAKRSFLESALRFRTVHRDYATRRKHFERAFAKACGPVLRARWPKGSAKAIDEMRATSLALSRNPDLRKRTISEDIDPIIAKLEKLLLIGHEEVLAAKPDLAKRLDKLYELHELLSERVEQCTDAAELLQGDPAGARWLRTRPLPVAPASLDTEVARLAREATPMRPRDREVLDANRTLAAKLTKAEEARGIRRLNEIRTLLGLPALRIDLKLCNAARDHSADMKRLGFFSHSSPVPGKRSPRQRSTLAGTSGGTENIAAGADSGAEVIRQWWYSPGHHRNMLGNHSRVGLGRAARLWTQVFGG